MAKIWSSAVCVSFHWRSRLAPPVSAHARWLFPWSPLAQLQGMWPGAPPARRHAAELLIRHKHMIHPLYLRRLGCVDGPCGEQLLHRATAADQLGQVLQDSVAVDDAETDLERSKPNARSWQKRMFICTSSSFPAPKACHAVSPMKITEGS